MTTNQHHNQLDQPIGAALPKWRACPYPSCSPMAGRWCRLVPLNPDSHAEPLWRAFSKAADSRDWTYLPYGPFESFDAFRAWLRADCIHDDPQFYAIVDPLTQSPVGLASYLRMQPSVGVMEVGHIHFAPSLQQTPAATESMFLMMRRAFDELGYRRYEWKCDALNERSRNAALRLGFSFEGIFRQATVYKGRNRDTAWFSIIDSQWPLLRKALEHWLRPDNFNENGRQRTALSVFSTH